jgi:ubiquinone/menaquinone biosynthesis C-methylase UbiE
MRENMLLQRAPDIDIKLRSFTEVTLMIAGESYQCHWDTLAILDEFSTPKTLEDGLDALNARFRGRRSWIDLASQIVHLHDFGVLQSPAEQNLELRSHPVRYDSAPVHIRMLNDDQRTHGFQEAIRETVTPADIVLDIGTGTGVLAVTAAMAGAKHVYAIECSSIAKLAQRIFDANGLSNRITLLEGDSTNVELPEKADVLVSEMIGNDPLEENILQITADAVNRLLKPQARLIPCVLKIFGLPLSVPAEKLRDQIFTQETVGLWQQHYGIDFSPLVSATEKQDHSMSINSYIAQSWLSLSDPILLKEIDLKTSYLHLSSDIQSSHQVCVQRSGLLAGILVYFELELGPTTHLSTHPQKTTSRNHWNSRVWIPGTPVPLQKSDVIELKYSYTKTGSTFELSAVEQP